QPCENEQGACADAVRDDRDQRALQRQRVPHEYGQKHESKVANTCISHQTLDIGLTERLDCTVKDARDSECYCGRRDRMSCVWKQGNDETQHSISPGLQEKSCKNDTACCWRFGMRVREPCVKQKHGQLDGESNEEAEHDPQFCLGRHMCPQQVRVLKCINSC